MHEDLFPRGVEWSIANEPTGERLWSLTKDLLALWSALLLLRVLCRVLLLYFSILLLSRRFSFLAFDILISRGVGKCFDFQFRVSFWHLL